MYRYKTELLYRGSEFHGWQIQNNALTIQGEVNKALSLLFSVDISCTGCGRTDSGVNAKNYVAHFNLANQIEDINKTIYKLNCILHKHISIKNISLVNKDFHARFSAKERMYKYFMHTKKNSFLELSYLCPYNLNLEKMCEATQLLIGKQDFTSFSKLHTDVTNNLCEIYEAYWEVNENGLVFTISADRFLRDMVRAIVGTLIDVGRERINKDEFIEIIEAKDRSRAGVSVPAHGLFLWDIKY